MKSSRRVLLAVAAFVFAVSPVFVRAQGDDIVLVAKFAANLNTKSAKVGDAVSAKITKAVKLKDGTNVPKGAKLDGKVTTVDSVQSGSGTSSLAIKFDQVEVKGAAAIPIQGLIVAIGPTADTRPADYNPMLGTTVSGSAAPKDSNSIPPGSTLEGVSLSTSLDSDGASDLHGVKREIKLDSDVMIKLELK